MIRGGLMAVGLAVTLGCGARTGLLFVDEDSDAGSDADVAPEPCTEGLVEACYDGPDGTASVGECRAGVRVCLGGRWGACDGQVLPAEDVCNFLDDDCDGEGDELGVCPPCGPNDQDACIGPDRRCGRWGDGPGLGVTEAGELTIAEGESDALWSGTFSFECVTGNFRAIFDPDVSGGGRIDVSVRGAASVDDLPASEWIELGTIPPDGPSFDLQEAVGTPHVLEVRTGLHETDGTPPVLRRVDVCWFCEFF